MKKRISLVLIVCLAVLALIFGLLWQNARNNSDDVRMLAQSSAASAYAQFVEYQDKGYESSYWYGVAEFRSFEQAYHLLTENTQKASNYVFCNEVYGYLVLTPESGMAHISEIVEVMEILAQDVEDENGYIRMSELRNILEHG